MIEARRDAVGGVSQIKMKDSTVRSIKQAVVSDMVLREEGRSFQHLFHIPNSIV